MNQETICESIGTSSNQQTNVISNISQERLIQVLETIPLKPSVYKLLFIAKGIGLPEYFNHPSKKNDESFIDLCKQEGVVPYSQLKFLHSENGLSQISRSPDFFSQGSHEKNCSINSQVLDSALFGGQVYAIQISSVNEYENSFKNLENLAKQFNDNEYEIAVLNLQFWNSNILHEYHPGNDILYNNMESFEVKSSSDLYYRTNAALDKVKKRSLDSWFEEFSKK